jgi:hypothetical protein
MLNEIFQLRWLALRRQPSYSVSHFSRTVGFALAGISGLA